MMTTLSVLPRQLHSLPAPTRNLLAKMSTAATPVFPRFVSLDGTSKFRIVSYNLLAQVYVKSSLFPHSPSPCLRWKARSQSILSVLRSFGADFLCLQEVDEYDEFYKFNLKEQGYSSIYIQRSGKKRDGCGTFYKHNSAELLLEENIVYNDLADLVQATSSQHGKIRGDGLDIRDKDDKLVTSPDSDPGDHSDQNDPSVRLRRDCVGIMAAFRMKEHPNHITIVANTHLYWDPEWIDVKIAQAKYLLSRLNDFRVLVSNRFECIPSVILCGDFNSTPGDKVYNYLVSGSLSSVPSQNISEHIPLCSTYAFTRGEPLFTNCTPGFTGTLDYIFFSPSSAIEPVSLLELPEPDAPDVVGGLPNYHHPSDHLPVGADFIIKV